jgi:hypothetical protein
MSSGFQHDVAGAARRRATVRERLGLARLTELGHDVGR